MEDFLTVCQLSLFYHQVKKENTKSILPQIGNKMPSSILSLESEFLIKKSFLVTKDVRFENSFRSTLLVKNEHSE